MEASLNFTDSPLKSTPPVSTPKTGMSTLSTSDDTILPKAPPIITPTAMSITLPFMANSLNSFKSLLIAQIKLKSENNEAETNY